MWYDDGKHKHIGIGEIQKKNLTFFPAEEQHAQKVARSEEIGHTSAWQYSPPFLWEIQVLGSSAGQYSKPLLWEIPQAVLGSTSIPHRACVFLFYSFIFMRQNVPELKYLSLFKIIPCLSVGLSLIARSRRILWDMFQLGISRRIY